MNCLFGNHICKTVFNPLVLGLEKKKGELKVTPIIDEDNVEHRVECMVCEKILYGPHIVSTNVIDVINDLFALVSG